MGDRCDTSQIPERRRTPTSGSFSFADLILACLTRVRSHSCRAGSLSQNLSILRGKSRRTACAPAPSAPAPLLPELGEGAGAEAVTCGEGCDDVFCNEACLNPKPQTLNPNPLTQKSNPKPSTLNES